MSAFNTTVIFPLDQNVIPNHFFSVCDAAEKRKATEFLGSETPINNSPEYSSSANSGALRHIRHSKPVVTSPEVLNKVSPLPHIPVNKTTKK
jgi:hypothetical protein